MGFKFFKALFGGRVDESTDSQWERINPLPQVKRTERRGMNKNFRVGRVKHVSYDRTKMLIGVIEMCHDDKGMYEAQYNLWINFDKEWRSYVSKDLNGRYVVVGFYMQSFRNKDMSDVFENVFSCRFINLIPSEQEARSLAIDISDSALFVDHPYLKISNINFNTTN